jgi:hypothetical protein
LLDTTQADDVAGFETLVFVTLLLELFRTDFSNVSDYVSERSIIGITALRLLLDAQLGVFEIVRFNPGDVAWRRALLHHNRLERRHGFHDFEVVAQDILVD